MKRCILLLLACCVLAPSIRVSAQDYTAQDARELYKQAMELYAAGRYDAALPLAERALAISGRLLGADHPDVALTLNGAALIWVAKGDFSRAEPLYQRALAIYLKLSNNAELPGKAAENVATTLNNLAELYRTKGDFARAEPLYLRALQIYVKMLGPEQTGAATVLNNLAELYRLKGDYSRAEPLFHRALAIYTKADPESLDVAQTLNNLAAVYFYKGDYARAEPLYLRALAIKEKAIGSHPRDVADTLNNLADLYRAKGDSLRAAQLLQRALSIYVRLGADHPDVAAALNNLAGLYLLRGDYARAEPLYTRALEINVKAFGPEHSEVARSLNNLAAVSHAKGDDARAETLYSRALAIREKTLGPEHPMVAATLNNLADLYRAKGDIARAVQLWARGLEIRERNFNLILASGSEDQKQLYINTLSGETHATVSLHIRSAPADAQAAQLALTTILRRKGRALDAMTDQIAALRQRAAPEDAQLLDQLAAARSQLATLQLSGSSRLTPAERQAAIARVTSAVAGLEDQVSRRSAEFRALSQPVTLEAVRQALPDDAALVEIVAYKPFNPKALKAADRFGTAEYAAYVLKRDSPTPQFVELGSAESIDADVAKLRAALHDPDRTDVKDLARACDERVMRPVRRLLGSIRHVLLSPDGALNLIPFAALVDERGQYLVENYMFSYLTSGRDLLRLQVARDSRTPPLVIGDPLYDIPAPRAQQTTPQTGSPAKQEAFNRRSVDFTAVPYEPLPGTAQEARALQALMPGAQLLLQQQATEAALKQARAPRILHIATHGFFLPDQASADNAADARALVHASEEQHIVPQKENPLLRSGIVLAGVKQQRSGAGEDGVLTALEAAGLDLWGTQLVVLSACETGLGEVRNGAGVYGLRRALVLAGSETQVMSLWSVSDAATRDLMTGFYKRLQAGEGRAEALRHTQLAMLSGKSPGLSGDPRNLNVAKGVPGAPSFSHPFYWAPFIESGAWISMKAGLR
ncbi:MAG TPA: CHAT domain-containing tetratricopeptide repeat protein [Blastocatellia bacterium]|nr:CHAT domain-containing tetratricopeptide repeat protein [Blastocatellia bacterium]